MVKKHVDTTRSGALEKDVKFAVEAGSLRAIVLQQGEGHRKSGGCGSLHTG